MNTEERDLLMVVKTKVEQMGNDLKDIKAAMKNDYVTRKEFETVRIVVFGGVGFILMGFMGALGAVVYNGGIPG